ncbi:MAG: aminoglycoside phosphotransferase family protein [Chlorobi bacterium]|nr:aminoglycoside phosphotransferase family protein [Chlorobiota bacterium]
MNNEEIFKVAARFKLKGKLESISRYGSGHINDTFLAICRTEESENRYILRRINGYVFKRPEIVIENTRMVLDYIKERLRENGREELIERTASLVESGDGKFYIRDESGGFWCAMPFCKKIYTIDFVETEEHAYQAAKAFGGFQKLVIDADYEKFKPSIPDFHNTMKRFERLVDIIEKNPANRNSSAKKEIAFALRNEHLPSKIKKLLEDKTIPLRLTHNDTKINNVLFDEDTNQAVCVIDLDTVMSGTALFDFGDMVRTSTCAAAEDETDLSIVFMNIKIFEALVKGYLEELNGVLTNDEIENLVYGAELIIYEQAIRFLTDYLEGDVYYKTDYQEHNLDRTKNQFALLKSVQKQKTEMERIVNKISNNGE